MISILPQNEQLNIGALSRAFDNMSESYKVFWFAGILDVIKEGKQKTTFVDIIDCMIVRSCYMVTEYHIEII